jgi:hypothetical protein
MSIELYVFLWAFKLMLFIPDAPGYTPVAVFETAQECQANKSEDVDDLCARHIYFINEEQTK